MARDRAIKKTTMPRYYLVRDTDTGKLIRQCATRTEADKTIESWRRRCERRGVVCNTTVEEVK